MEETRKTRGQRIRTEGLEQLVPRAKNTKTRITFGNAVKDISTREGEN